MPDWIQNQMESWLLVAIRIALILLAGFIARLVAVKLINRTIRTMVTNRGHRRPRAVQLVSRAAVFSDPRREQRIGALGSLGRSVITVIVAIVVGLMILSELNFPIATLLAGTSIVGIAVAFGIQSILRDVISGIAMLIEDQIGLGDNVRLSDVDGVVENIGLRLTQIRDADGTVWYLRNGDLSKVANYSQGSGTGRPPVPEPEPPVPDPAAPEPSAPGPSGPTS